MAREVHKRRLCSYPRPKYYKMSKAFFDIHGYTDSQGIEMFIKFYFSQFSEHEQKKLLERYDEINQ